MATQNRQTAVDEPLRAKIRQQREHMGVFFQDYYEKAILAFMEYRHRCHKKHEHIAYLSSPQGGKDINIKMSDALLEQVTAAAKQDSTSVRRLLYTAILKYSDHNARCKTVSH